MFKLAKTCSVLLLSSASSLVASIATADSITIRMGSATADLESDVYKIAYREFASALEALAPGDFNVIFFPNRQLGDESEMVQGLQLGTLDMAIITNSSVANVAPQFVVNDLPFLYGSHEVAGSVLDGNLGQGLLASLDEVGIVGLSFCTAGYRHMLNNIRPITVPEDVVGGKYRVMQSPIFISMFEHLQGNPVPMAWGDTITAFQQGAIDGVELPTWVVAGANLDEVARYMSLTRHVYSAAPLMMSRSAFQRLSTEQQETIREAATMACHAQRTRAAEQEGELLTELAERGRMEINDVPSTSLFREAMLPVFQDYRERIGSERLDAWLQAVGN